jgi:anti-sigma regulatory factor (Ser/Thr protein kinase)
MTNEVSGMLTCSAADIYDLTRAMPDGAHLELGAIPSAVPTARAWAHVILSCWNLPRLADDAGLVLTELVTNSVLHAHGRSVTIWLRSDRVCLAIMVGDPCPDMPVRAEAQNDDGLCGRGLVIVSALAEHWGAYRVPAGKIVWAMLAP